MEEKKKENLGNPVENGEMTYDQLKAYADYTVAQANRLATEHEKLKTAYKNLLIEKGMSELGLALKCLDHAKYFSEGFIKNLVSRIEEALSPLEEESKEE